MPNPIFAGKPLDHQIHTRIGQVAVEWSWIESLLSELLAHFCHADHGSMYVVTQDVSPATVTGWLRTLVEIQVKDADTVDALSDMFNEIDDARARRNAVIHGMWSGHDDPGFGFLNSLRWTRQDVARSELWSTNDLDDLIHDLNELQLKLGNLGIRLGYFTTQNP